MVAPNVWLRTSSPVDTLDGARRQLERLLADVSTGIDETWTMPAEIVETADELRFTIELMEAAKPRRIPVSGADRTRHVTPLAG